MARLAVSLIWAVLRGVLVGAAPQAPSDRVAGEVTRFFRGHETLVNGFLRVPHQMVNGVNGAASAGVYRVELEVTDQSGTVLTREAWTRRVPWTTRQLAGSQSVEPFAFAVAPGTYDVKVAVQDSGSGVRETVDLPLTGFESRPGASDLLLAYAIRAAAGNDTLPNASEVRKGKLLIAAAPDLTLTPRDAVLWYYCEAYRDSAGTVPWLVRVLRPDGSVVISTAVTQTAVAPGGGQVAASLDLAGLPPGSYMVALVLGTGADTLVRTAGFRMAGFETERHVAVAESAGAAQPTDMFADVTEARLDSLFEPLVYIATPSELSPYEGLTLEGKRRFLRAFWSGREAGAGPKASTARAAFYNRIDEANRRFREGGASSVPGWRTDRGRVFIRYGEPDETRREPQSGINRPWEAWKYTRGRSLKFVFLDYTRVGNYSLIYSNDKLERTPPDWQSLLDADAIGEIADF